MVTPLRVWLKLVTVNVAEPGREHQGPLHRADRGRRPDDPGLPAAAITTVAVRENEFVSVHSCSASTLTETLLPMMPKRLASVEAVTLPPTVKLASCVAVYLTAD